MKIDKLVLKRFDELEKSAEDVTRSKQSNEFGTWYDDTVFQKWATSSLNLLDRALGRESVHYISFFSHLESKKRQKKVFDNCRGIMAAAKEDYERGYIFNLRSLVKSELLIDALEQAEILLNAGYKDPACILIGVSLELTLKDLCERNNLVTGKLESMNVELRKQGIFNIAKQKQITAWADLRNKAAHGEWAEYNHADVKEFLTGVDRFISDYM